MRSYGEELVALDDVYTSALALDVDDSALGPGSEPLLAVGSGGSGTVAHYVADVHRAATGAVTRALTPLEVLSCPPPPHGTRVVLISAGGANTDVLAAWERIASWDGTDVVVLCGDGDSALGGGADNSGADDSGAALILFDRCGEESFVACASVLGPAAVAANALGADLPERYADLVGPALGDVEEVHHLSERNDLVVLHGTDGAAAARCLESNFTEAALGAVSPSDFRNFAHGRYLWLEREGPRTGLMTVESEADTPVADATIDIVGDRVPVRRVQIPGSGPVAGLRSIAAALEITGRMGDARGIDPAQPGIDPFGPVLYDLEWDDSGTPDGC